MNEANASLENLRPIIEPAPPPWWPPAPGWWVLAGVIAVFLAVAAWRGWRTWVRNAYRRAALEALKHVRTAAEVDQILKRAALAAFPRENVAALTGHSWRQWLETTSGLEASAEVASAIVDGPFQPNDSSAGGLEAVVGFAGDWIRNHRQPERAA